MCTGIEIALLAAAAVSAVGAVQQGQAQQQQANFQAEIAGQQAAQARQAAGAREEDFRRNQSRVLAARRAALGSSGVDPAAGSPLLVAEDFASEAELQALRIRQGGEVFATRAEQQAELLRFQGRAAARQGFTRGGALLVSGAGKTFAGNTGFARSEEKLPPLPKPRPKRFS